MSWSTPSAWEEWLSAASDNLRFSAAAALFDMLLRRIGYCGGTDYKSVIATASASRGADPQGCRAEFVRLVQTVR